MPVDASASLVSPFINSSMPFLPMLELIIAVRNEAYDIAIATDGRILVTSNTKRMLPALSIDSRPMSKFWPAEGQMVARGVAASDAPARS